METNFTIDKNLQSRNRVDFVKPPNLEVEYWIYHKTWGVFVTKYEDSSPTHMENLSTIGIEPFRDAGISPTPGPEDVSCVRSHGAQVPIADTQKLHCSRCLTVNPHV